MDITLAHLEALLLTDPDTQLFLERRLAHAYDEFVSVLKKDLDRIVQKLEDRKQLYFAAKEDPISMYVVDLLDECGYDVLHDPKIGGHIDILVRGRKKGFQYIVEAKRDYGGMSWIEEGMQQLCARYSSGGQFNDQGALLIYCQKKDAAATLGSWRTALVAETKYVQLDVQNDAQKPLLAFVSTHKHDTSGLPYTVRHMVVGLYHKPTK